MNINKKLLFFLALLLFFQFNFVNSQAEEKSDEVKDIVDLDEEELPAIDPFQSSSGMTVQEGDVSQASNNQSQGILGGLRLVGTIIGKNKKIAILSGSDGFAYNFEEDQDINENVTLVEIFEEYLLIQDKENKIFEVYMNNIIKPSEG